MTRRIRMYQLETSIDDRDQEMTESERAHKYTNSILDPLREPLILLNAVLKILSVNRSFYNPNFRSHIKHIAKFILKENLQIVREKACAFSSGSMDLISLSPHLRPLF